MQRLLFFCRSKGWGGTEKHTVSLAKGLQANGYTVRIIINSEEMASKCKEEGIRDVQFKKSGGDLNPFALLSTYAIIKSFKPDLVFLLMNKDYWLAGLATSIYKKAKCILWLGIERTTKQSFKYKQIFGRFVDLVVVNSELIKTRLLNSTPQLSKQQVKVIYNGIEIKQIKAEQNIWKNKLGIPQNCKLIGAAGRLTEQKGFDFLPEICNQLEAKGIEFKVLIAGDGPDLDLIKSIALKFQVLDRFIFLGFVDDMDHFFVNLDVFVLPSRHEGMAFVLNEAMSFGVPIVSHRVSGADELLLSGDLAPIIEIGDTGAFAEAIYQQLIRTDLTISDRMKKHIQDHYSFDAMILNYEKVMTEL